MNTSRCSTATPAPVQAPSKDPPPFVPPGQVPVVPVPRPTPPSVPNLDW